MNANDSAALQYMLKTKALRLAGEAEHVRQLAHLTWMPVTVRQDLRSAASSLRSTLGLLDDMIEESVRADPLAEVPFTTGVQV